MRGNGKIIQELEAFFRGAGWNVIKVIWGRSLGPLLAQDSDGALVNVMNATPDGDFQTYKSENGGFIRDHFFGRDPRTRKLVEDWSDEEIWALQRGGHDYRKMYAAYQSAIEHKGQPTVVLAKTIKGWTLGSHFEGRNSTHQMKKLTLDDLKGFRDRLRHPDRRRRHGPQAAAVLPARAGQRHHALPARASPGTGRLSAQAAFAEPTPRAARRRVLRQFPSVEPASSRWPPPWRSSGCSRTC